MWKHDNFFVGVLVALLISLVSLALLIFTVPLVYKLMQLGIPSPRILVLAIAPAIFIMRYYMRKLHYSKSGSGVLVVIFIAIILWFVYFADKLINFPTI